MHYSIAIVINSKCYWRREGDRGLLETEKLRKKSLKTTELKTERNAITSKALVVFRISPFLLFNCHTSKLVLLFKGLFAYSLNSAEHIVV